MIGFALLTAAKNEEDYIEHCLRSVVRQTTLPVVWCIVDDGSNDRTAEIVRDYAERYQFIRLISAEGSKARSFGAQYRAINRAYGLIQDLPFDFVGVQDADIAVKGEDYFQQVLEAFALDPGLGIAGGYICERANGQWKARIGNSADAVAGGVQMFRRTCFDEIGGYKPLAFGGEDWLAQIEAKQHGWSVVVVSGVPALHYRATSSANGRLRGLLRLGRMDAAFGSHPVFEVLKCGRRIKQKPLLMGSLIRWLGYVWESLLGDGPRLSPDQVVYLRSEQRARMMVWQRKALAKFVPRG